MDWELCKNIATIASPIIGALAIIVALLISRRSSKNAQRQIEEHQRSTQKQVDAMSEQLDAFIAAKAPDMLATLDKYQKQLAQLDEQIREAQQEFNTVNPFYGWGGARIDDIEYEQDKLKQGKNINQLKQQRKKIVQQIELIQSFLKK